ncbi:MAG: hypothetical protein ABSG80_08680 [Verrucomicrobiota bacterium]
MPAGALSMEATAVGAVVPAGFPAGFDLEAQPTRPATLREKITANAIVFIVLIFARSLSEFGLKLQFFLRSNTGALKMIPLLNESA